MGYAALHNRLHELAADIGHLRRRSDPDSSTYFLVDRIAGHTETLIQMLEPTAAQLAAMYAPGQADAIDEAIRIVDARHRSLQHRLGR